MYVYVCVCICLYMFLSLSIYIYIERERDLYTYIYIYSYPSSPGPADAASRPMESEPPTPTRAPDNLFRQLQCQLVSETPVYQIAGGRDRGLPIPSATSSSTRSTARSPLPAAMCIAERCDTGSRALGLARASSRECSWQQ